MSSSHRNSFDELGRLYKQAEIGGTLASPAVRALLRRIAGSRHASQDDVLRLTRLTEPAYQSESVKRALIPLYPEQGDLKELLDGDLPVGFLMLAERVTRLLVRKRVSDKESPIYTIVGEPGTGKTWMMIVLILGWLHNGGRVIVFDRESWDFSRLLRVVENSLLLPAGVDRDPLLTFPELNQPYLWNSIVWDALSSALWLIAGAVIGRELCEEMLKRREEPRVRKVLAEIRRTKGKTFGRERDYVMRLESGLQSLCSEAGLGRVTDCNIGISFSKILGYDLLIYDISRLSQLEQYIYTSIKLLKLFHYLDSHAADKPVLVCIDEAEYIYGDRKDAFSGQVITPPHETIALRGRKRGLKLLLATQYPSRLSREALESSMLVCFRLHSILEQRAVQSPLALSNDELHLLGELPAQTAIVRM